MIWIEDLRSEKGSREYRSENIEYRRENIEYRSENIEFR
jgi:hypothetical protein